MPRKSQLNPRCSPWRLQNAEMAKGTKVMIKASAVHKMTYNTSVLMEDWYGIDKGTIVKILNSRT